MTHTPWQRRVAALTALTAAAWLSGQALAQGNAMRDAPAATGTTRTDRSAPGQNRIARDMRASRLIGMDVYNPQGREIGEIKDLVVDVHNQRVLYAVLGVGGFLGMGEKMFAYPLRSLKMNGERLQADLTQAGLRSAPSFEVNAWPDWNDPTQRERIDRYHGSATGSGSTGTTAGSARLMRASEIIGRDIDDTRGGDAGEIEDLVVSLDSGQVRFAVVDFDKAWSPDDKLLALPLDTLSLPTTGNGDAVLQVPRDRLDMANGFEDDAWPDLDDPQVRDRLERQLPAYQPWSNRLRQDGTGTTGPGSGTDTGTGTTTPAPMR